RSQGFATEEIPGGCFCCRFNSLVEAARTLTASARPDVFIAEPVGSCTDLVATVTYPLRRLYGDDFRIAPLSVLVDPIRARRILGLEKGGSFSEKVLYIYRKQLEEADLIVVSKRDLLDAPRLAELVQALERAYPKASVLSVSARTGDQLEPWFVRLTGNEQARQATMAVDYDVYADGEALLGWLNATVAAEATTEFDGNALLQRLATEIQSRLATRGAEVAHLKMTLSPDQGLGDIAVVNLVRNDFVPELSLRLEHPVRRAQVIVNLRAECPPDFLRQAVEQALAAAPAQFPNLTMRLEHAEQFQPGRPTPTHRDQVAI
ncbi:MAG: cobalamin biosynthesis protein P47K, partial [Verrucomicrobiales bacterium]|nr:cobalamin biosynthesis protein P47K [Verrucomicrobiales bacterium]